MDLMDIAEEQLPPQLLEEDIQTFFKSILVDIKSEVDKLTNYFIVGDSVEKRIIYLYKVDNETFMHNWNLLKTYYTDLYYPLKDDFPDPDQEEGVFMRRRLPPSLRQDAETQIARITDLLQKIDNILLPGMEGGAKRKRRRTHKRKHHKKKRTNKNRK
jgi:hypothetical protein